MERLPKSLVYKTTPLPNEDSVFKGEKYRFTFLTSRLVRAEYSEDGSFEDRATQTVVNRAFPKVDISVREENGKVYIKTSDIELRYKKNEPFTETTLAIKYIGKSAAVGMWYFTLDNDKNLGGTARTLDFINGECELQDGIMGQGVTQVLDDSLSLLIAKDGWVEPRDKKNTDVYIFNYALPSPFMYDYYGALKDYYTLTGKTPLLPRFALGNWWSRYHEYSQEEYENLISRFSEENIPFSVSVVDMDWHITKVDPKYSSGWTGYTWNTELFPNHKDFLSFLHNKGMKIALNLHPAEGICAHEEIYPKMAEAMGINPKTEEKVNFDFANPDYVQKYFDVVLHPMEEDGVDFWWLDWQQGSFTEIENLDPLWMLNHYHFLDNGKDGRTPITFSRYAGAGSHRYPIGFSGDTFATWETLKFQPYFTLTASNIGYGWWSHDIGGHMFGECDHELYYRWVQFGVFSPINRIHVMKNELMAREPWKYDAITEKSVTKFLRLRHELIPYLYTMNYRASKEGIPLVCPMYYERAINGDTEYSEKYDEYLFGSEMMVAPIVAPADSETTLGSAKMIMPEGTWFDLFSNRRYRGGKTMHFFRNAYEMPVFIREGGIVPLAKMDKWNDYSNPKALTVKVCLGKDRDFTLYESDDFGKELKTKMSICRNSFIIDEAKGDREVSPRNRDYIIEFVGISSVEKINSNAEYEYKENEGSISVCFKNVCGRLELELISPKEYDNNKDEWAKEILFNMKTDNKEKLNLYKELMRAVPTVDKLASISSADISEKSKQALTEVYTAY